MYFSLNLISSQVILFSPSICILWNWMLKVVHLQYRESHQRQLLIHWLYLGSGFFLPLLLPIFGFYIIAIISLCFHITCSLLFMKCLQVMYCKIWLFTGWCYVGGCFPSPITSCFWYDMQPSFICDAFVD